MALNEFITQDYLSEARSRVTYQFSDKPIFDRYLQLMIDGSSDLQDAFKDLMQKRSIDTATGETLNIIGRIVGQDRVLVNVDIFDFFGFLGVPNASGFGTVVNTSVGSIFYSLDNPRYGNLTLTDEMYRLFIKAKIAKNITSATPEQIMDFANFIFGTTQSTVQEEGGAGYTLYVSKQMSGLEQSLLRYVDPTGVPFFPKPIGVRANYGQFDANQFFAFAGVPNARGFGSFSSTAVFDGSYNYDGTIKYLGELNDTGGKFATILGGI